jgi:uncharacterized membrane protein
VRSLWRREPWLLVIVATVAAVDAMVAVLQHVHFETGLDLSFVDQTVWNYSHLTAPFSSILGKDILGDHFSPLVAVLTPLYWIWSDPRMLLIAQSVLVAASVVPVFLFSSSSDRLGRAGGYAVAIAYACYWPTQVGVAYDFHELAFSPLLIALTILFCDRRRWTAFWITTVLLLCVKEDMAVFVIFFGVYLLTRREFRQGCALVVVGLVWYELAVAVAIPAFSHGAGYAHWTYGQLGPNLPHALWTLIHSPWKVFTIGFSPSQKVHTMLDLFVPFLFLALGSRLFILAVPLLAERFLSTNAAFWGATFQYSMPIAPVIAMGAVDTLSRLRRRLPEGWRDYVVTAGAGLIAVTSLVFSLFVIPASALSRLRQGSVFTTPAYAEGASEALAHVPHGVPLATVPLMLPHASERYNIQMLGPRTAVLVPYMLVNVTDVGCCGATGDGSVSGLATDVVQGLATMTPLFYDHGWLVAERAPPGHRPGNGALQLMSSLAARALNRRLTGGERAIAVALSCARKHPGLTVATLTCDAGPLARYRAGQVAAAGAIASLAPGLTGGCADLARAAVSATRELTGLERAEVTAAGREDRAAFLAAHMADTREDDQFALSQRTSLFVALCSPRPS